LRRRSAFVMLDFCDDGKSTPLRALPGGAKKQLRLGAAWMPDSRPIGVKAAHGISNCPQTSWPGLSRPSTSSHVMNFEDSLLSCAFAGSVLIVLQSIGGLTTWMAGTSPAMTDVEHLFRGVALVSLAGLSAFSGSE
jgi:hypothetical protein